MAEPIRGAEGDGTIAAYDVPRDHAFVLELLRFTLVTDITTGSHSAMVSYFDRSINQFTAQMDDWNEVPPSTTVHYTFGIGLAAFSCTVVDQMYISAPLPQTTLAPDTRIILTALDDSNNVSGGDTFLSVVLYGELLSTTGGGSVSDVTLLPGLLPA